MSPNSLLERLKQRRIWRVLVGYPSVTFVLLQAVEFFVDHYALDPGWLTAGLLTAVVFFPAAVLWNWRHGEVGEQPFTRGEVTIYALSLAAALLAVGLFRGASPPTAAVAERAASSGGGGEWTVAVMPFANPGGDPEAQYLCDGIAEGLINWLATLPELRVVSKTASFRLRDAADDTPRLVEALGVDRVVRGRLERVGDRVVVSAELVDASDESQVWGDRLIHPAGEALFLERDIVDALKSGLRVRVAGEPGTLPGGTDDPRAYESYLRGHHLIQATDTRTIEEGVEELRAAIRVDPRFARAYADIADALAQMLNYGLLGDERLVGEARNAAYTAVALAPDLAESQTALASILTWDLADWREIDGAYEAAIALEPRSPVPYHRYADFLVFTQRFQRAREMARRAMDIDPLDGSAMHAVGIVEFLDGNFAEAARAWGEWNHFHPQSQWSWIKHGLALGLNGECDAGRRQIRTFTERYGTDLSDLMESWVLWAQKACGEPGWRQRAERRIELELARNPGTLTAGLAYLTALTGDGERLLDLMESALEQRDPLVYYLGTFRLKGLRWDIENTLSSDPRYLALLDRIGLPPMDAAAGTDE